MNSAYLLKNGVVVDGNGSFRVDVRIAGGRIREMGPALRPRPKEIVVDCGGGFLYPGLINSHDHLAFNLYPRLGTPLYENAYQWGEDLHRNWKGRIEIIQAIPLSLRLRWGAWKNLFSGVTRVIHHDHFHVRFRFGYDVDVLRRYTFAHSLRFEQNLPRCLSRRKPAVPFLIHIAEGTDEDSFQEVDELDRMGGVDGKTVAIHAIGVREAQMAILRQRGASVVWCPSSNQYLFGATAPVERMKESIRIALGTDSTLSGSVSMFDELRSARELASFSPNELFRLVTTEPRKIFSLPNDAGAICELGRADLFLAPAFEDDPYENLLHLRPGHIQFLMRKGRILYDNGLLPRQRNGLEPGIRVHLNEALHFVRTAPFARLARTLKSFLSHYTYLDFRD